MIASLLVDEFRAQLDEEFLRGQLKRPPPNAEERLESVLSRTVRPGRRSIPLMRARQMALDAERYDREMAEGKGGDDA